METGKPGVRSSRRRAVEDRAVAWLTARRAMLDPREARPDSVLFVRKALIETAFLVGLRARLDDTPLDGDYADILQQVADVAGEPSYREMIARDEQALLLYAGTYAALRLCGRDDPEFRHVIQQAVDGGYAAAFERVPYRQLDLLHTLYLCGVEHDLPAMDTVLPFTLLCRNPNVLKLADADVYAITHTLFYVTDFGLREPVWPDGHGTGAAVELLEALLVLAEGRANADLVGELLCCLYCLGVDDSQAADRAWDFLESVQEDNGRVNGPVGVVHPGLDHGDEGFRHWAEGYHTTIVTALAGLLRRSPLRHRAPRRDPAAVTEVALGAPLRRAVVWLCEQSTRDGQSEQSEQGLERGDLAQGPGAGLAGVTAAALGAAAIQEHHLAVPALEHHAALLAAAPPGFWQEQGMEVAGEFALALRAAGADCPSLTDFLKATADVVGSLDTVPDDVADGVRKLVELGFLPPSTVAAAAAPRPSTPGERRAYPARTALALCEARESYHLGRVAALVRGLVQEGWGRHRITRDALAFLLAQQGTTGAFGHCADDDRTARARAQHPWTRSAVTALAAVGSSAAVSST
ncbi:DUF6895 family protein [Streptomyces sp. NPDC086787]|uniref:DUF6895 family protein n=1 Tax=Streptomyces sp. NPDC086787 TaxID=3365759 RepID=UPI0038009B6E